MRSPRRLPGSAAAGAETCEPGKLGTSRVVEVGTHGGLEVGLKTYPQTIPLADHEVILTFDDGPAAKTTPEILDALADECVRATFFDIGRNAEGLPQIARREALDGHRSPTTPGRIRSRRFATCPRPPRARTYSRA